MTESERDRRKRRSRKHQQRKHVQYVLAERREMGNRIAAMRERGVGAAHNGR